MSLRDCSNFFSRWMILFWIIREFCTSRRFDALFSLFTQQTNENLHNCCRERNFLLHWGDRERFNCFCWFPSAVTMNLFVPQTFRLQYRQEQCNRFHFPWYFLIKIANLKSATSRTREMRNNYQNRERTRTRPYRTNELWQTESEILTRRGNAKCSLESELCERRNSLFAHTVQRSFFENRLNFSLIRVRCLRFFGCENIFWQQKRNQ